MQLKSDPAVDKVFKAYPAHIRPKMEYLRQLVLEMAESMPAVEKLEETLKWGEPSYIAKKGSTLRMDWKAKKPDQYAMYFKCTSQLVLTFKKVFGDTFKYEKHRAIVFTLDEKVPKKALQQCIRTTLQYHQVKHLPDLGLT